jgi:hypothetical protein
MGIKPLPLILPTETACVSTSRHAAHGNLDTTSTSRNNKRTPINSTSTAPNPGIFENNKLLTAENVTAALMVTFCRNSVKQAIADTNKLQHHHHHAHERRRYRLGLTNRCEVHNPKRNISGVIGSGRRPVGITTHPTAPCPNKTERQ